jgi:hypothetical protein
MSVRAGEIAAADGEQSAILAADAGCYTPEQQ